MSDADAATTAAETTEATAAETGGVTDETTTAQDAAKETPAGDAQDATPEPFTLTAPEGAEAFQADFDAFAGDMNTWLTANPAATPREALIEAANRQARMVGESQAAMLAQAQRIEAQSAAWRAETEAMPEFTGDAKDKTIATVIKGVKATGGDELLQMLDQTGLGNHPGLIRMFLNVGKDSADTEVVTGKTGTSTRRSFASALYGNG